MGSVLKNETWSYVDGWPLPVRYRLSPGIGRAKRFGLTALAEKWLGWGCLRHLLCQLACLGIPPSVKPSMGSIFTAILNRAVNNRHDLKACPGGRYRANKLAIKAISGLGTAWISDVPFVGEEGLRHCCYPSVSNITAMHGRNNINLNVSLSQPTRPSRGDYSQYPRGCRLPCNLGLQASTLYTSIVILTFKRTGG